LSKLSLILRWGQVGFKTYRSSLCVLGHLTQADSSKNKPTTGYIQYLNTIMSAESYLKPP